jgi:hypothetical protein
LLEANRAGAPDCAELDDDLGIVPAECGCPVRVNFSQRAAANVVCEKLCGFLGAECSGLFFGFDGACDRASREAGRTSCVRIRWLNWRVLPSESTWWLAEFVLERVGEREFGCITGVSGDDRQRGIGVALGASGARIVGTLAHRLVESGERWGVAAICIGVGQGLAIVLENMREVR